MKGVTYNIPLTETGSLAGALLSLVPGCGWSYCILGHYFLWCN